MITALTIVTLTGTGEQLGERRPGEKMPARQVLLADPVQLPGDALRSALVEHAGCGIVQARSVREVHELISGGVAGELAMVSVRFNRDTPVVIRALLAASWARVMVLTTAAVPSAPVLAAINAGATSALRIAHIESDAPRLGELLSHREREVIMLVAEGCTNKIIGVRLELSALTVKNHLTRIGKKFGAGDRAQLVAIACRGGII